MPTKADREHLLSRFSGYTKVGEADTVVNTTAECLLMDDWANRNSQN